MDDLPGKAARPCHPRGASQTVVSPARNSRARGLSRSFIIGRKGLLEDLKRFQDQGLRRFQRLVTEYEEFEVGS